MKVNEQTLVITPNKALKDIPEKVYFRVRINKLENILTKIQNNNFFLEGIFKEVGFVEFDINIHRRLPKEIADKLSKEVKFKSMNFFYITDTNTNIIYQNIANKSLRLLEKYIWNEYLVGQNKTDVNKQKIIAFHWKNNDFQDFNLFLKLSYTLKNDLALFIAFITLLIFGMLSGMLGNYLTDFIKNYFFDSNDNNMEWINFPTFLIGILIILLILPIGFYSIKKLYNLIKKIRNKFKILLTCLKKEWRK